MNVTVFGPIVMRGFTRFGRWETAAKWDRRFIKWRAVCRYRTVEGGRREVTATDVSWTGAREKLHLKLQALESSARPAGASETVEPVRVQAKPCRTVREAMEAYRERLESGEMQRATRTVQEYGYVIKNHLLHPENRFANKPLDELTARDIKRDMERIITLGKQSQLRHYKSILSAVLADAYDAQEIDHNPLTNLTLPKGRKGAPKRTYNNGATRTGNNALTDTQRTTLYKVAEKYPQHIQDLLTLFDYQGLRVSEAVSLRWQDINLQENTLTVAGKIVRIKNKGLQWEPMVKDELSFRTIPLLGKTSTMLQNRLQTRIGEYVFTPPDSKTGMPDQANITRWFRRLFDEAEMPEATIHIFRRTVEERLEQNGATIGQREHFLGHKHETAIRHYTARKMLDNNIIRQLQE